MNRWDIINEFVDKYGYEDYLEIGLDSGICRDNVRTKNKTTVDPLDKTDNPTHLMTSDEFFRGNTNKFDVIFIDGLHEAPQVYRDILNSLECLKDGGTILCHDMLPTSEDIQAVPRISNIWTGDCWKSFMKLRGSRKDLEMFVVQDDWGVGVIRKGSQDIHEELNVSLAEMDWAFYLEHKSKMNYIDRNQFLDYIKKG